jgi:hypothetical protein
MVITAGCLANGQVNGVCYVAQGSVVVASTSWSDISKKHDTSPQERTNKQQQQVLTAFEVRRKTVCPAFCCSGQTNYPFITFDKGQTIFINLWGSLFRRLFFAVRWFWCFQKCKGGLCFFLINELYVSSRPSPPRLTFDTRNLS